MEAVYFTFKPEVQELIDAGIYRIGKKGTGELFGTAVDQQGHYAAHAVAVMKDGKPINPFSVNNNLDGIQKSLGILQSSTAILGVGVVASVALSAVNLWQVLKLREDVRNLDMKIDSGFINLKEFINVQNIEIIEHIDAIAQDLKFNQHKTELIKAYGRFSEASRLIKRAILLENSSDRAIELSNARQTLNESLAIYKNQYLLEETSVADQLRRYECSWIIEQLILKTYQLQSQFHVLKDGLNELQEIIKTDCIKVIDKCNDMEELDFIYPEVHHVLNNDLLLLDLWNKDVDWRMSLSQTDILQLSDLDKSSFLDSDIISIVDVTEEIPSSLRYYQEIKKQSHFSALSFQLRLLLDPDLREHAEEYIQKEAIKTNHEALDIDNLKYASDLSIANLMCFFSIQNN